MLKQLKLSKGPKRTLSGEGIVSSAEWELQSLFNTRISILEERLEKLEFKLKEMDQQMKRMHFTEEQRENNHAIRQLLSLEHYAFAYELMKIRCLKLEKRVLDLKKVLMDNNIDWNDCIKKSAAFSEVHQSFRDKIWYPEESYLQNSEIDFDSLVEKLAELSYIASQEEKQLCLTSTGATFKPCECISVTLYADGLTLSDGKLQKFSDISTKNLIRDIMDGFFPAELQHRYPEGVIFQVTDKRTIDFKNDRNKSRLPFNGLGSQLGGRTSINNQIKDIKTCKKGSDTGVKHETNFNKCSKDKLPLQNRQEMLQRQFPKGLNNVCVKVISDDGNQEIILSLPCTTLTGHLLCAIRKEGENSRLLMGYPPKQLTEWSSAKQEAKETPTLKECGIMQNCLLRIQSIPNKNADKNFI